MLRHLIRNFEHTLTLQTLFKVATAQPNIRHLQQRHLFADFENNATKTTSIANVNDAVAAGDQEYIVPYRASQETGTSAQVLIDAMRFRYRLTDSDVKKIMSERIVKRNYRKQSVISTMEVHALEGVTKRSLISYPWLLTLDINRLTEKYTLLRSMPVRDINHFVPFLRLTLPRLRKLVSSLNQEATSIPCSNRIYFISEKLQVDPAIVSKYLSKRLFILEMPFEMFEQNLQHMINYNISPINILKDLWAFRYTPKSVELRLERAKRAKKYKIMPWMVRCPEPILQRSLKLSMDELSVLDGKSTVCEYVGERLQFSASEAKAIMDKHPQVNTVRVTKIKEVLDYLLDEAGFSRFEIAQVPRILCHSLKTTKERLKELKSYGCRPTSLVVVCRSKREYEKFLNSWISANSTAKQKSIKTK